MEKDPHVLGHRVANHEQQRISGLPGFQVLEKQLEAALEKIVDRYSTWKSSGPATDRISLVKNDRAG
ncbi:MAG: hypothetical protein QF408_09500 [Pirellulales bacterium]|nr:hypothetical protein [Pirellulales bacterium]